MFVKWEISAVDILSIPGCILLEEKSQRGMDLHRKLLNVSPDKKNPGDKRALTGDLGLKYECEDIFPNLSSSELDSLDWLHLSSELDNLRERGISTFRIGNNLSVNLKRFLIEMELPRKV